MRSAIERRQALLEILCERRYDKIENLAFEFGVGCRTIRRDIELLETAYPIYTTKGMGGGVHIVDGYSFGNKYLTNEEKTFLENVATGLTATDSDKMHRIIGRFAMPTRSGK